MFTIKHIDADGNEFAIEAESYFIERYSGDLTSDKSHIRLTTYDEKHRGENYSGLWAGRPSPRIPGADSIYIMNRTGATISEIHFRTNELSGPAHADVAAQLVA